jgi:predicted transcriptional regulator of viral defense system
LDIADLADRQHGVVAHRQLVALGIGKAAVQRRARAGRLHRLHRGVYAVGHRRVSAHGHWMAAVLAYGPTALLSHRSAATLWGIRPTSASRADVTVDGRTRHHQHGIVLHLPRHLHPEDRVVRDAIPITSIARTLLDLAPVLQPGHLRRALNESERLGCSTCKRSSG